MPRRIDRLALLILFALVVEGCGGGGGTPQIIPTVDDLSRNVGGWEQRSISIPGVGSVACSAGTESLPTPNGGRYTCSPLAITFSPDGSYSGLIPGSRVAVFEFGTWSLIGKRLTITAAQDGQPLVTRVGIVDFTDQTRSEYVFTYTSGPYFGYKTTYHRIPKDF